uniref:DDHD domain-containing protein n=1 Tax=Ditylenchus dipsaci TaxID=166011 RepID=A0A915EM69_9BILA
MVTLPRMSTVRTTLNSVALDIMYYQSPLYRTEIVNGVIQTLNNVYTIFMKNNPTFDGAVSIFAHSLGCVISYDILTNWSPFLLYDEFVTNAIKEHIHKDESGEEEKELLESFYNSRKKLLDKGGAMKGILIRQEQQLKFKVKYLFCVGSPLAVFIIMRGADYKTILPQKDQVERIFNIFHPYDPVAFRLEPLFHENYRYIRPLKILSYGEAKQSYDEMTYQCHKSYLKKKKKGKLPTDKSESDNKNADTNDSDSDDDCESVQSGEALQGNPKAPSGEEIAALNREGNRSFTPSIGSSSKKLWSKSKSTSKEGKDATPAKNDVKSSKAQDITPPRPPPPNMQANSSNSNQSAANDKKSADYLKKKMGEASELIEEIAILDYSLQPALTDKSYWSMLKSHFAYWTNPDVTNFVLNTIYQEPTTPPDA